MTAERQNRGGQMKAIGQITERDIAILKFINEFGFCEMPHLNKKFQLRKPRNYQILGKLIDLGFVKHERVFHGHGIYCLSKKGAQYTDLPPIKKIPVGIYRHEILLIELYFELMGRFPDVKWISVRKLIWDKFRDGVGQKGHVADGMMIFPDGKKIMIELELSVKGRYRSERILRQYGSQFDIHEVWYFCADHVLPIIGELAANKPYIRVHLLRDYVHAKS